MNSNISMSESSLSKLAKELSEKSIVCGVKPHLEFTTPDYNDEGIVFQAKLVFGPDKKVRMNEAIEKDLPPIDRAYIAKHACGNKVKVYRFMSMREFKKYIAGSVLFNGTDFYFMPMLANESALGALEDLAFMKGVVTDEVLCVFETNSGFMTKSTARYADPYGHFGDVIYLEEYHTQMYDCHTHRLLEAMTRITEYTSRSMDLDQDDKNGDEGFSWTNGWRKLDS